MVMTPRFADQILQVFDVPADAYEFLARTLELRAVSPNDFQLIFDQSLLAGAESWNLEIDFIRGTRRSSQWLPLVQRGDRLSEQPWKATDRLIEQANELAKEAGASVLPVSVNASSISQNRKDSSPSKATKRKAGASTSHYWRQEGDGENFHLPMKRTRLADVSYTAITGLNRYPAAIQVATGLASCPPSCVRPEVQAAANLPITHINAKISPYFTTPAPAAKQDVAQRPPPGTISCIPFPSLKADSFGLIQEQVAHEPFWLFIVVTFLIKTSGQLAIPAFLKVKERFPTPYDIAHHGNAPEILDMIRHLGLCKNRLRIMQKYAQAFMFAPPRPGVHYTVRRYEARDLDSDSEGSAYFRAAEANDGWEIGHLTQGKYAIDSWRIFCRDVLLGRAEDWNGKGREAEFQPEWMRVLPADKELRAYLRWKWMREGWEWDPATGERTVLREEMRRAVDEGRVEYDEHGGLRILGDG